MIEDSISEVFLQVNQRKLFQKQTQTCLRILKNSSIDIRNDHHKGLYHSKYVIRLEKRN
jgi:hypothetical protein